MLFVGKVGTGEKCRLSSCIKDAILFVKNRIRSKKMTFSRGGYINGLLNNYKKKRLQNCYRFKVTAYFRSSIFL